MTVCLRSSGISRLRHRPHSSLECNLARWQHVSLCILRGTDTTQAKLFVAYEDLIAAPDEQARRLAGFLDGNCGVNSMSDTLAAMTAACDSALWRNRDGAAQPDDVLSVSQRALYRFQQARLMNSDAEFHDSYPMRTGWRDQVIAAERRL
jgi:hypothetical protein